MDPGTVIDNRIFLLRKQIDSTEAQLRDLKCQLEEAELSAQQNRDAHDAYLGGFPAEWIDEALMVLQQGGVENVAQNIRQETGFSASPSASSVIRNRWPLQAKEYKRYGRQLIMPEIGLHGQIRLRQSKVLIVGMGGLGCPAAAYLAGAGVGTLGLVDGDTVEESNLHRQIAHSTNRVGLPKVESAYEYLVSLNPEVLYHRYPEHLTPEQVLPLFQKYDLVLDCTDHPTSRYLISDGCVLAGKPLVSASALKTEGQLIVLNNPPQAPGNTSGGPCYRCIFPRPPPADSVISCGEGGILGPVVGTMGVLQALEAIKILSAAPQPQQASPSSVEPHRPTMLVFSAYSSPPFRSVRMRSRHASCATCSSKATVTHQALLSNSLDYMAFCGATSPFNVLGPQHRLSAADFARLPRDGSNMLIDVRDETQYAICALRGSINVPWTGNAESWLAAAREKQIMVGTDPRDRFLVCRFGNDSQLAAKALLERRWTTLPIMVKDIRGGFQAWREEVDPGWPDY